MTKRGFHLVGDGTFQELSRLACAPGIEIKIVSTIQPHRFVSG
jgi:hypothetical protein